MPLDAQFQAGQGSRLSRRGMAVAEKKAKLAPWRHDVGPLGPREIDIRVTHNGLCHTDIHMRDDDWGVSKFPFIPGHEGVPKDGLRPGDRAGVGWISGSCRTCAACLRGEENVCESGYTGLIVNGNHGGFQDVCRVDSDFAYKIPPGLDSAAAAPLLCAGITVYSPLRRHMTRPGMRVGVLGVGGLGHLALQFAARMGADVTALDVAPDKARARGPVSGRTPGHFDLLLNCASAKIDAGQLMSLLKNNGTVVGIPGGQPLLQVPLQDLVFGQKKVAGTIVGGRADMQVNEAMDHVASGKARYRVVLTKNLIALGMRRWRVCAAALLCSSLFLVSLHEAALAQNLPQGQAADAQKGGTAADNTTAVADDRSAAAAEKPLPLPQAQAAGSGAVEGGAGAEAGSKGTAAADGAGTEAKEAAAAEGATADTGNIFGCPVLRDVCVDQGVIIYQDARYHPWTSEIRFPGLNITDILWNTPSVLGIGDKWKIGKNRYQPIVVRPWHHMEESPDVAKPVFSACTTPLLFYHHFPFNVAEVYRFAVNNIYFMQQKLKFFDQHITLVPGNPPMSRVPPYTSFWLQPFSTHAVTSLGRLSQRREPDQAVARSDATGEGTAVRCFKRFVMCKITLKKPTGAYFEAGQFVAEHYMKQVEEERRGANYSARLAAALPGGAKQLADPTVLKVVFAVRSKSHKDVGRVLLNEDELIDRCNAQEVKLPNPGSAAGGSGNGSSTDVYSIFGSMACIRHIFGVDNLYDMWLVRQMDVLVGVHGSALTNAMFMRPGSSLIELRPFGFSGRESWPNIYMKSQTRRMDVFWFGIDVMSANLSSPGEFENDMQDIYTRAKGCIARDRNVAVPWAAMGHQLLNIAVTSRSVWRYKAVELPGKEKWVPKELLTWFTDLDQERTRAAADSSFALRVP
eukprot:XP_001694659.1 predicted protein [Chlamydomonas reinhardtii]